ncbi:hydrogenase maturation nickel metallochaperone HypA/HybF [Heliorestis convoluta]|uniref:Hydrogenase nickel incorporation protein hypA n=1 Tax=Heliorestis convoluta TaxID=356322 RepID=A0A5Q2N4E2_9FIRM|nr:hydrogenase maturation nickel metallochaperone HypA [Heliorestis convoluta]QGG48466.1 Putative hydrogenase nickel incorporation protein hypA [Heliorestis convoluta]
MALMQSMVSLLQEEAAKNKIQSITKVKMSVGALTHALPDALQFAFSVVKEEPPFSPQALLEIEWIETRAYCNSCTLEFEVQGEQLFTCPQCQSFTVKVIAGRELSIDYFEGE